MRSSPRKFVWYVGVSGYEEWHPLGFFDSESKAKTHLDNYVLRDEENELQKFMVKVEVY